MIIIIVALMGRQNDDPAGATVGPSIALLQERFKKLERIKEKREEERQFISSSSEPKSIIPTDYNNYNSFSDKLFLPSRNNSRHADCQDPLSLGLNLNKQHADYRALNRSAQPSFSSLWSVDKRGSVKTPQKFEICDVDTSLHL